MITIADDQHSVAVDIHAFKKDAQTILDQLGYGDYDLGILLTTDERMHEYNKNYRNKDQPTDILSFPFHPELKADQRIEPANEDEKNLGDIILAPNYIDEDLYRWGMDFDERMQVLLVHGICHLLGYDHIEDKDYAIMHAKEQELLNTLS